MTMRRSRQSDRPAEPLFRLTPMARSVQLALLPGLLIGLNAGSAFAAPTGGALAMHNGVPAGSATITQNASKSVTTINQTSHRVAIDWQTFNVYQNELVQFKQPSARASALNRIFDQRPSEIFGQIKANGKVVLMNPNGVFFKPGAQVNVGSLIAGAMQIGVGDFMSGNFKLEALENSQGRVVNEGRIEADPGGDVTLVGKSIANQGVIIATAGRVNLVAGEQVTVDFDGDGLLKFTVDKAVIDNAVSLDDQISNTGDIIAAGGDVLITASAADGVFKNAINNGGTIHAARIDKSGGTIRLVGLGPRASVLNTGVINVSAGTSSDDGGSIGIRGENIASSGVIRADATQGDGGSIRLESEGLTQLDKGSRVSAVSSDGGKGGDAAILGDFVQLNYDAAINVSGTAGGGEALVGGDYQGKNPDVRNASLTFVSANATINADALDEGDGGKVIVWSDDTTHFHGQISARGGEAGGDGGFAEVSGKNNLVYRGHSDLSADNGHLGTLLLDPGDLDVDDNTDGTGSVDGSVTATGLLATVNGDTASTITWEAIAAEGATANMVIAATGRIRFLDVDTATTVTTAGGVVNLPFNSSGSLTFTTTGGGVGVTNGNIEFQDSTDVINLAGGDFTLTTTPTGALITGGTINTGGGDLTLNLGSGASSIGAADVGAGTLTIGVAAGGTAVQMGVFAGTGGALTKNDAGTLTLSQANTYSGVTTIAVGTLAITHDNALGTNVGGPGVDDTVVASGATLEVIAATALNSAEDISIAGAGVGGAGAIFFSTVATTAELSGDITLTANATISADDGNGGTTILPNISGVVSGAFDLTKIGADTLDLTGMNTYSGQTFINAGTLGLRHNDALGTNVGGVGVDDTVVASGATLEVIAATALNSAEDISIAGAGVGGAGAIFFSTVATTAELSGDITLTANATISADDGNGGTTILPNISGVVSGAFDLTKIGADTLDLTGMNTYSGQTFINAGTLGLRHNDALGTNVGGVGVDDTVVASGATLEVIAATALNSAEDISIAGAGVGGAGAIFFSTVATTAELSGDITLTANATISADDGNGGTTIFPLISGVVSGAFDLTKIGADALDLSGVNTYSGQTFINAGILGVLNGAALGTSAGGVGVDDTIVALGAELEIVNVDINNEALTLNGGALGAEGAGAVADGGITLTANSILNPDAAATLTLNGVISGPNFGIDKQDAGTVVLNAVNTYTGTTTVSAGTLSLGTGNDRINAGSALVVDGGIFDLVGRDQTVATISGTGGVITSTGGATLSGDGASTFAGDITGAVALNKTGSGTLTLSGTNTYTGTTSVGNTGTL